MVSFLVTMVCPLSFLLYVEIRQNNSTEGLLETRRIGTIVWGYIWLRKWLKNKILDTILPSSTNLEWEKKIVNPTAAESFSALFVFLTGFFVYEFHFFGNSGTYSGIIEIDIATQLQAFGSLLLAFEAVLGGLYQITGYSDSVVRPTELKQKLEQRVQQYVFRFSGAILLALGYSFTSVYNIYVEVFRDVNLGIEPIWVLLAFAVLVIGIRRTMTHFFAITSPIFGLISLTILWHIYDPPITIAAVIIFMLTYLIGRQLGYPGVYYVVFKQHMSNKM